MQTMEELVALIEGRSSVRVADGRLMVEPHE